MPPTSQVTAADVIAFTQGDCWALARTISGHTGWQAYTLGAFPEDAARRDLYDFGWVHVVVQTPTGRYLDVEGVHDAGELNDLYRGAVWRMYGWHAPAVELQPIADDDWDVVIAGTERQYPTADVDAVAAAVLRQHGEAATTPLRQSFGEEFTLDLAARLWVFVNV